jgi:hypothetical protein
LQIATEFKARKAAQGEEAARLSLLLTDHAQQENHGLADFRTDLADLARIVELFNAEENVDVLVDLKDNLLRPALARITYQFDLIQDLKLALFGKGYAEDGPHQRILAGIGGLYTLRRDTLLLRRQREKLEDDIGVVWHEVDAAVVAFGETAQTHSRALTVQMEQILTANWQRMLVFGVGCLALFLGYLLVDLSVNPGSGSGHSTGQGRGGIRYGSRGGGNPCQRRIPGQNEP